MDQAALDDRRVPDELIPVVRERVDAAETVVPVPRAQLTREDVVEQRVRGLQGRGVEVGGVGGADDR